MTSALSPVSNLSPYLFWRKFIASHSQIIPSLSCQLRSTGMCKPTPQNTKSRQGSQSHTYPPITLCCPQSNYKTYAPSYRRKTIYFRILSIISTDTKAISVWPFAQMLHPVHPLKLNCERRDLCSRPRITTRTVGKRFTQCMKLGICSIRVCGFLVQSRSTYGTRRDECDPLPIKETVTQICKPSPPAPTFPPPDWIRISFKKLYWPSTGK